MSATITGRLNKPASIFDAGDSKGFGIRLGERYYDRETKQKEWTNYQCVIFAKNQAQIDFYSEMLVEGAIVSVSCSQQKLCSFDGQNGTVLYIEMIGATLQNAYSMRAPQQPQQPQQSAPTQQPPPSQDVFDDDLLF